VKTEPKKFGLDAMVHLFEQRRWAPEINNGMAYFFPSDQDFHAVFLPATRQGVDWVLSASYPLVSIPKSPELARFVLEFRGHPGLNATLEDAGAGLVNLVCFASFPAQNLDVDELDDLFMAVFPGTRDLADEIIGRFGGKWKSEE
jgi:hypothetical protein